MSPRFPSIVADHDPCSRVAANLAHQTRDGSDCPPASVFAPALHNREPLDFSGIAQRFHSDPGLLCVCVCVAFGQQRDGSCAHGSCHGRYAAVLQRTIRPTDQFDGLMAAQVFSLHVWRCCQVERSVCCYCYLILILSLLLQRILSDLNNIGKLFDIYLTFVERSTRHARTLYR